MACLLFLWARAAWDLNFDYDIYFFCLLLALETPSYLRIIVHLLTARR